MKLLYNALIQLVLAAFALLFCPLGARSDIVYVWSNDGTIQKFSTNGIGTVLTTNLSGWNGPVGLALDNVGNLYSGWPGQSAVWRFSPDGGINMGWGGGDSVSGLAFSKTGELFESLPNYNEIMQVSFNPSAGYFESGDWTQSYLNYPVNMAFDNLGAIYVSNTGNPWYYHFPNMGVGSIEKFSMNLVHLGTLPSEFDQPWGLAFDRAGNLFVSNSGTNQLIKGTIEKIAPDGSHSIFAYPSSLTEQPRGLAFDSAGNLYAANFGDGTIIKYDTNGVDSVFATGLNSPCSIAVFPGLNVYSATPVRLTNTTRMPGGGIRFSLIEASRLSLIVLASTNLSQSPSNWTVVGEATEISPRQYQFTDSQATNGIQRFYRVRSP